MRRRSFISVCVGTLLVPWNALRPEVMTKLAEPPIYGKRNVLMRHLRRKSRIVYNHTGEPLGWRVKYHGAQNGRGA